MQSQQQSRYLAQSSIRHGDQRDAVQTNWINEPEGFLDENWCYHCASPLKHLSNDMRKTIRQFLHVRRTTYPHGWLVFWCERKRFILFHTRVAQSDFGQRSSGVFLLPYRLFRCNTFCFHRLIPHSRCRRCCERRHLRKAIFMHITIYNDQFLL
uniref:Uncharacterized protein n=1 Tax=Angiostrongylus cantonensis TaxID=6313 RepID=A0A0K0D5W7_ANGCA